MNIDICGPISDEAFQNNSYRTSNTWKSTALKTFRRDLYMKIDPIDYFDSQGQYYVEKPDAFIHYALVELAGKEHTLKVDEPLYYYNYDTLDKERRSLKQQKSLASLAATMLTPYQALNSLGDKPKRVQSYVIP